MPFGETQCDSFPRQTFGLNFGTVSIRTNFVVPFFQSQRRGLGSKKTHHSPPRGLAQWQGFSVWFILVSLWDYSGVRSGGSGNGSDLLAASLAWTTLAKMVVSMA